jgi:hypothetical protein
VPTKPLTANEEGYGMSRPLLHWNRESSENDSVGLLLFGEATAGASETQAAASELLHPLIV